MVLSDPAMARLKQTGRVVYLSVPFEEISRRVTNIKTRGIAFHKNETLADVYRDRVPLYEKYADITVSVNPSDSIEETVDSLVDILL